MNGMLIRGAANPWEVTFPWPNSQKGTACEVSGSCQSPLRSSVNRDFSVLSSNPSAAAGPAHLPREQWIGKQIGSFVCLMIDGPVELSF